MSHPVLFKNVSKLILAAVASVIIISAGIASAAENNRQGGELLLDTYRRNVPQLSSNSFGLPLVVESFERNDRVHVDVYGIFDYPFDSVVSSLTVPATWCSIVPLHPNIKACTYRKLPGTWQLTMYPGSKEYQPPKEKRQVTYLYQVAARQQGYLDILLSADTGPYGTKKHMMRFEALPLNGKRTYVHVSYSYSDSAALRLAVKIYFATLGRGKVGFTVTGTDIYGNRIYIGGPRGALERSAVRYFFAIQSFMNTERYPEESRFSMRISEWHDLTSRYRRQLFDLSKKEYLSFKTVEHENQSALQRQIGF